MHNNIDIEWLECQEGVILGTYVTLYPCVIGSFNLCAVCSHFIDLSSIHLLD